MKILLFVLVICFSSLSHAAVWNTERAWSISDSKDFSNWISSEKYHPMIFLSKDSPYSGIKSDCADAVIAAKIIYSYEKKLPFVFKSSKDNHLITNKTELFDDIDNDLDRLKAFIHHVGQSVGTEALARYNSFPVKLNKLRAGDFYITRWKINGRYVRHVSMIKKILITGHLVLYSSTTPLKVRRLTIREGMPLHSIESRPWGFKRFVFNDISLGHSIEEHEDFSLEQYDILEQVGKKRFFSRVIDELKTKEDTLEDNLKRRVRNLCSSLKERQREVKYTVAYLKEMNSRCLSKSEFELHSTPSRDQSLQNGIKRLLFGWKKIRRTSYLDDVSENTQMALDYMLRIEDGPLARDALNNLCHIYIKIQDKNYIFNLKNFFDLKRSSKISFNPNDGVALRWGFTGTKTHCKPY